MFDTSNPYSPHYDVVAASAEAERTTFIRKTYLHLAVAVGAFVLLEAALMSVFSAQAIAQFFLSSKWMMLAVLGGFVAVSWVANAWAQSSSSRGMQYAGLSLYVVAEAVVFLPMMSLSIALDPKLPLQAGLITLILFGGLTAIAFLTKADFSWMGRVLCLIGIAAFALAVAGLCFGFSLGLWFSAAMIVFAGAYILYDTSNIMHHYNTDQYVAASLALFASVALLFWYVLRLLMSLNRE